MCSFYDLPPDDSIFNFFSRHIFKNYTCGSPRVGTLKMEPAWEWIIERVEHPTTVYRLDQLLAAKQKKDPQVAQLTVGRKDSVDIHCDGSTVSRNHCKLTYSRDKFQWFVTEKSTNGIFINSARIPTETPVRLNHMDVLGIGAVEATKEDYFLFKVLHVRLKQVECIRTLSPGRNLQFAGRVVVNEEPSLAEYSVLPSSKRPGTSSVASDAGGASRFNELISSASEPRTRMYSHAHAAIASTSYESNSRSITTSTSDVLSPFAVPSQSNRYVDSPVASTSKAGALSASKSNRSRESLSITLECESMAVLHEETDKESHLAIASTSYECNAQPIATSTSNVPSPFVAAPESNRYVDSLVASTSKAGAQSASKSNSSHGLLSTRLESEDMAVSHEGTDKESELPSSGKHSKGVPPSKSPDQHSLPSALSTSSSKLSKKNQKLFSPCYVYLDRLKLTDSEPAGANESFNLLNTDGDESSNDEVIVPKPMTAIHTRNYQRIMSDSEDDDNNATVVAPLIQPHSIKKEKPDCVTIKEEVISPKAPKLTTCSGNENTRPGNDSEHGVIENKKQTSSKFVIQKLFNNPDQYLVSGSNHSGSNHSSSDFYSPTIECLDLVDDLEEPEEIAPQSNAVPEYEDETLENYSDDDIFLKLFEDDGRLSNVQIKKEPVINFKTNVEESEDEDDEIQLWSRSLSQTPTKREITDHSDSPIVITLDGDDDDELESPILSTGSAKRPPVAQDAVAQFWPELSQNFYDDEREEDENRAAEKVPMQPEPKSKSLDKLEQLTKTDRFKPHLKTIQTCAPKPLESNKRKRFSLATPDDSSLKDTSFGNVAGQSKTPRTLKIISPRPQAPSSRRRTGKKNETVEKMKQTVEGGKRWIKPAQSSSKTSEISTNPVPAVGTGLTKKFQFDPNFVIPRKSNAAPVVKAKTTAVSRSDLLVQDLIGNSDPKQTSDPLKVTKKTTTDQHSESTCSDETGTLKRKTTEDKTSDEHIPLSASEYIPKKKRIARISEDSESYRAPSGSKSSASSKTSRGKSWTSKRKCLDGFSETLIALGNRLTTKKMNDKKAATPSSSSASSKETLASKNAVPEGIQKASPEPCTSSHAPVPEPTPAVLATNSSEVTAHIDETASNRSCLRLFPTSEPKRKKSVSFDLEKNCTQFIEPRPDTSKETSIIPSPLLPSPLSPNVPTSLPQPPTLPLALPPVPFSSQIARSKHERRLLNTGKQLISDVKMRILKWNYLWIHEQKNHAVLPPLLQMASDSLPELRDKPVNSTYANLEQYFNVFHPLMLHELWAQLTKEYEQQIKPTRWDISVKPDWIADEEFTLIRCSTTAPDANKAPRESDLVVLKFMWKTKKNGLFGIVENARLTTAKNRPHTVCDFMLRVRGTFRPVILESAKFAIERVHSLWLLFKQLKVHGRLSFSPLCQVILSISKNNERTFEFIQKEPQFEIDPLLNPSQKAAVTSVAVTMVEAPMHEPRIALLQGPPGTGKSHVIVQIVKSMIHQYLVKMRTLPRILICAPSNFAVDEITYRLLQEKKKLSKQHQQIKLVRVGVLESMDERVKEVSVDDLAERLHKYQCSIKESPESNNIIGGKQELRILMNKKKGILAQLEAANAVNNQDQSRRLGRALDQLEETIDSHQESLNKSYELHYKFFEKTPVETRRAVINEADIICSTLNSCNNRDMDYVFVSQRNNRPFLCCIVDEASQCTEPESLTPLILGVNKLVMVGDPEQLPATVCSKVSKERHFDQSLFNRFFSYLPFNTNTDRLSVLMLNTQYRMHPDICYWPSKFFYGNQLLTSETLVRNSPFNAYRVFNVLDSEEKYEEPNISNECEAEFVVRLVQLLVTSSLAGSKSIGVISFYQKQRSLIQEKLKSRCQERFIKRVKVNTVDAFQGQEEDIIIVSCVRASKNSNKKLGFVTIPQRLNVALTRAKESLFVCGHFDTLRTDETWRDMIEDATARSLTHNVTSVFELALLKPLLIRQ